MWGCWTRGRREVDYSKYVTLDEFGEFYYGKPLTQTRRNTMTMWCREGWLKPYAKKLGRRWFIRKEVLDD